jgi:hypothetical protein
MKNFDIDSAIAKINTATVNIHDYSMLTPTLAKVIVTYTGESIAHETMRSQIAGLFKGYGSPVLSSFRKLDRIGTKNAVIGFVKSVVEVRSLAEANTEGTKMRAIASNLLMDETDKSLWEIKTGSTGQYIARQGNDDFSGIVGLATARVKGVPMLSQVAIAATETQEFAAYVCPVSEEVNHGYVVASTNGSVSILPFGETESVQVAEANLVEVVNLDGEDQNVLGRMSQTAAGDKSAMIEYYKKAYSHSEDYIQKIIDQINQHSFA